MYIKNVLTREIILPFVLVGKNLKKQLLYKLKKIEGKCSKEGYIKRDSINLLSFSSGQIVSEKVLFKVSFECDICRPVEGMVIKCTAKNITKAGIRAEVGNKESPVLIFISRDHHYKDKKFSEIKEEDNIEIRVIGIRFELNDKYVSIIGEFIKKLPKKIIFKNT